MTMRLSFKYVGCRTLIVLIVGFSFCSQPEPQSQASDFHRCKIYFLEGHSNSSGCCCRQLLSLLKIPPSVRTWDPVGHSQSSNADLSDCKIKERKGNARIQEDTGKRKRKKPVRFLLGLMVF